MKSLYVDSFYVTYLAPQSKQSPHRMAVEVMIYDPGVYFKHSI